MKGTKGCKRTLKVYMRLYKVCVYLFYAKNTYSLGVIKKFHKFKLNENYSSGFELIQLISLCYWIKYLCSNSVYIKINWCFNLIIKNNQQYIISSNFIIFKKKKEKKREPFKDNWKISVALRCK